MRTAILAADAPARAIYDLDDGNAIDDPEVRRIVYGAPAVAWSPPAPNARPHTTIADPARAFLTADLLRDQPVAVQRRSAENGPARSAAGRPPAPATPLPRQKVDAKGAAPSSA